MAHVFTMALGPVQDFIAAARRTRDFWLGSRLLSELARSSGEEILKSPSNRLIFPHPERVGDGDATFTNKILAVVDSAPAELGAAIQAIVRARVEALRADAFRGLEGEKAAKRFFADRARLQIDDLIELQWASAEITADRPYAEARRLAEALLAGRKNTRDFLPVSWGDRVPKSAIDGQRESVIHEDLFDAKTGLGADHLFQSYRAGGTERLCGVSLLKRLGRHPHRKFEHQFLSTGHLAAWPLLERLEALPRDGELFSALRTAWQNFLNTALSLDVDLEDCKVYTRERGHSVIGAYDAGLLFESRLHDLIPTADPQVKGGPDKERKRTKAAELLKSLQPFLRLMGEAPRPYYAVLHADGDHMGKAIENIADPRIHCELSARLTEFAKNAAEIVETRHRGELILAGGDDVLALVPLHRCVACARELATTFKELLSDYRGSDGSSPTLSVGVGISHYLEPLTRAVLMAGNAEKRAKKDRNSLALTVDKRSGAPITVVGHWGELDAALDDFVELHVGDLVPDGLAFELRELARLLEGAPAADRQTLRNLVTAEAQRILGRKQPKRGSEAALSDETRGRLDAIYDRLDEKLILGADRLGDFADRMIVARLLAEAALQAQPVPTENSAKRGQR